MNIPNNFVTLNKKMLASLGVVINASSILILYLLVYTIFHKSKQFENNIHAFKDHIKTNDIKLRNLVNDINHNDQVLKQILS